VKQLEEENGGLKRLVADLTLDKVMLQDVLSKKILRPAGKRARVGSGSGNSRPPRFAGSNTTR
jgi:hypothetical protein